MTHELSGKPDSSQVLSPLQVKFLTIILKQILSHERQHSFDLGSTRRTHAFSDGQTYVAATCWGQMLDYTAQHITNLLRKLEAIDMLKLIKMRGWTIVEISKIRRDEINNLVGIGNFEHDEIKKPNGFGGDHLGVNPNGFGGDHFGVENTEKHGSNGKIGTGFGTAADYKFVFKDQSLSTKENKHSAAPQTVWTEGKKQREQSELIVKAELPEEQREKRKAMRGVERAVDLLKNPALKKSHIHELIAFNDRLSELPDGILIYKPRIGLISRRCVGKWRQMTNGKHRRHQLLETFLEDTEDIFNAIKRAEGAHGTNWFRFEWLLSFELAGNGMENQYGEHNIEKLLSGRYQRLNEWVADQRRMKVENRTNYEPAGNLFDNDSFI